MDNPQVIKFYDSVFDADKRKANQDAMKLANFLTIEDLEQAHAQRQ